MRVACSTTVLCRWYARFTLSTTNASRQHVVDAKHYALVTQDEELQQPSGENAFGRVAESECHW